VPFEIIKDRPRQQHRRRGNVGSVSDSSIRRNHSGAATDPASNMFRHAGGDAAGVERIPTDLRELRHQK
jgi:hypothetical protein